MKCDKCCCSLSGPLGTYLITFEDGHTETRCNWCWETVYNTKAFWFRKYRAEEDTMYQYWFFNTKDELVDFIKKTYSRKGYELVIYIDHSMWTTYEIYLVDAEEGIMDDIVGACSLNIKIGEDFDEFWHYYNNKQLDSLKV